MSATVHHLPSAGAQLVTKQQLAAHLQRSPRWIEIKVNEGMPSENLDRFGRRMFNLAAVERWLAAGEPKATSTAERLEKLERQVAELTAEVRELRKGRA